MHTQQATFSNFSNHSYSKVLKRPNMCYIFETRGIQGYQIWHYCVSNVKYTNMHIRKWQCSGKTRKLAQKRKSSSWSPFLSKKRQHTELLQFRPQPPAHYRFGKVLTNLLFSDQIVCFLPRVMFNQNIYMLASLGLGIRIKL